LPQSKILCPSSRCIEGSHLLGIVKEDGFVSIIKTKTIIDNEFVQIAKLGRNPEKRFRFANNCVTTKCKQWKDGRCSVIDKVIAIIAPKEIPDILPECPIRSECRWYKQCGSKACIVCSEIITDLS
jgi:hypothetical protein